MVTPALGELHVELRALRYDRRLSLRSRTHLSASRTDVEGLDALAPLWSEWYRQHREVSEFPDCWEDLDASWASRLDWYRRLLMRGASYVTASDDEGRLIGYAMVAVEAGFSDTSDVEEGIAEVVTLVVTRDWRSRGLGRALLRAAEDIARDRGLDTVKIAVMTRNARAREFYEACGYVVGEHVLYRSIGDV